MCGRKEKEMEGDIQGEKERASVGLTLVLGLCILGS